MPDSVPVPTPDTAAPEPTTLACGCEWITKYCDEHHYEINERAKRRQIEQAHGERIAQAIEALIAPDVGSGRGYGPANTYYANAARVAREAANVT